MSDAQTRLVGPGAVCPACGAAWLVEGFFLPNIVSLALLAKQPNRVEVERKHVFRAVLIPISEKIGRISFE